MVRDFARPEIFHPNFLKLTLCDVYRTRLRSMARDLCRRKHHICPDITDKDEDHSCKARCYCPPRLHMTVSTLPSNAVVPCESGFLSSRTGCRMGKEETGSIAHQYVT